jgi:hypothetical protein
VNLYAVVLSVGKPKRTRGSDFMLNLTVGDEAKVDLSRGLSVNLFRKDLAALPLQLVRGDIVRLHRIEITDGSLYGGSLLGGLPEKTSSFLCIAGAMDAPLQPYFVSSQCTYQTQTRRTWHFESREECALQWRLTEILL